MADGPQRKRATNTNTDLSRTRLIRDCIKEDVRITWIQRPDRQRGMDQLMQSRKDLGQVRYSEQQARSDRASQAKCKFPGEEVTQAAAHLTSEPCTVTRPKIIVNSCETFVVRQASEPGRMVLSLRTGLKPSIEHFLIQNAGVGLKLKGCFRSFEDISKLITHYGHNQDGLPVQLVLPHAVMQAKTHQELTSLALLGQDFWTSSISRPAPVIRTVFHTTISPQHDTHTHQKIAHHNLVNYHREPHSRWQPSKLSSPSVTPPFENIWNKQSDASHYQNVSNDLLGNCAISTDVKTKLGVSKTDSSPIIHKEYNSLSLTNHSRECSAFCTPPVHDLDTTAYNNYNVTELADKLSDYEDAQGPFFQPILHNSSDTSSNVGDKNSHGSGIYDLVGCNALHNPGYMSDCLSEKSDYIDSHFLINLDLEKVSGKKLYLATEHVEKTEKVRLMQLVPKRLVRNGPAVFTFTVVPSTPTDGTPAPATPGGQISVGKVSSAGSQHSTPSYIEPYDSLLPKVAGAGHNIPVVRVNNILKQPGNHHYVNSLEVKPCQADVTPNHHSYSMSLEIKPPPAPHRTEVHHDENKSNIIPRNKHEVHHVSMKMPQNSGLHQRRRETSSMLISHLEVVKKPPPKVFIRSQSLRCLPTTGNKAKEWRAQSLPRDVSDLKAKGHHRGSLQTVIEPSSHVCVPVHTTVNPEQHLANGRCEGIKAPLSSKETREINSHLDEILGNLDELHMLIDDPLPPTKMLSATLRRFPQGHSQLSLNSGQTAYSDTCTAEDVLNNISPELTLRPIKPLTAKNLQRRSDYDNLSNMWGPSSRRTIASSVGTHYSQPWDSNILQDLITFGSIAQQGKFPMPTDKGNRDSFASRHSAMTEYSVYESESGRAPSEFSFEMAPPDGASPPTGQNVRVCVQASDDEGMEDDQNLGTLPLHGAVEHIIAPSKSSVLGNKRRSSLPGIKVRDYVSDLAQNRRTTFGKTVDNFIACTKEGTENNPHIVIRNIRQFMNGIKNYLVQNGEGALNDVIEEERKHLGQNEFLNIDALLEGALHKCVVKPLERHILALFVKEYKSNGSLQNMKDNIEYARTKTPFELGIKPEFLPPEGRSMEKIKQSLHKMQRAYSPTVKLHHLLGATSAIYKLIQEIEDNETASSTNSTVSLGADDFLPMFIYVLVQCGMVSAEIEVDYMWGLLHPYILAGEGGYHLTTLSSAVHVLKNLKNTMESTTDCGFMKIIIPDEDNHSIITKILPVRPNMTTKDVVNMIAHRFKFTNPQDYGLYILISGVGTEDRLQDGDCPQTIKESVIHEGRECVFAYKRNNANDGCRDAYVSVLKEAANMAGFIGNEDMVMCILRR
ncbi:hypothetical protein LSH36_1g16014 [Paralvinella palmiformis]|uniref:Protein sprint n=1 Tax=Paralvinella palmiformis TaxID=53620 RepID=A0AAD9KGB3_9ANNE|nr:hypothetical protein LSH36_1g16014 [Paralvinella palmiformis]